jgi:hypothetical protein
MQQEISAPPSIQENVEVKIEVEETKPKKDKEKKKSKLELKLEAARKEKEEADRLAAASAPFEVPVVSVPPENQKDPKKKDKKNKKAQSEEVIPAAVSEESQPIEEVPEPIKTESSNVLTPEELAILNSTLFGDEISPEYTNQIQTSSVSDEPAEKLTRREKKKRQQQEEAKASSLAYDEAKMKASVEGAQFAVSQSVVDPNDPLWQNSLDINIPSLSISAHNKELFVNTEFAISHGRRYGLVGPNGAGKSTLLKMISSGELKLPPRIDFLYVEQEVLADDTPAVDAVLRADKYEFLLFAFLCSLIVGFAGNWFKKKSK